MAFLHNTRMIEDYKHNVKNDYNDEEACDIYDEYYNKKFELNEILDMEIKIISHDK